MIGIDLIRIDRMRNFIERHGERGLEKFLTKNEIAIAKNHKTVAGFWAAKEACSKALGCGIGTECGFLDIEISKTPKGAPIITLQDSVKKRFNIQHASLSITHDGDYAIAVVALK